MKILIIEDDSPIVEMLRLTMSIRWPKAEFVSTKSGQDGIELAAKENPSLIILDLGLPDLDGLDVLKQIRTFSNTPIIILTVRKEESDIVQGLELGADEYIVKPFRQMEILARIRCILRRQHGESDEVPISVGALNLLPAKRRLIYEGKDIVLTTTETRVLQSLMMNAGRAVNVSTLAESLWGECYPGAENAIRVYICRLRERLESDPSKPQLITTRPGIGYCLNK
jgi:two-component system KDP operon response regulator KdpE